MADDERVLLAGEVHLQAVELLNHHAPAADAGRAHGDRFAACPGDMQDDGVRVRCAQRNGSEAHLHPRRGRHGKRVAQARVVHVHAHQAADERAVGAVSLIRFFKRAVQADFGPRRRFAQQIARDAANARRSRRMRRRGADHHRADNIKKIHEDSSLANNDDAVIISARRRRNPAALDKKDGKRYNSQSRSNNSLKEGFPKRGRL